MAAINQEVVGSVQAVTVCFTQLWFSNFRKCSLGQEMETG